MVKPDFSAYDQRLLALGEKYAEENLYKHNTWAVQKIARQLRRLRIPFRREVPVIVLTRDKTKRGRLYIIDFYFEQPLNFIIEVDGGYHKKLDQAEKDRLRDEATEMHGLGKTFRYTNEEILEEKFDILNKILYNNRMKAIFKKYWDLNDPTPAVKKKKSVAGNSLGARLKKKEVKVGGKKFFKEHQRRVSKLKPRI